MASTDAEGLNDFAAQVRLQVTYDFFFDSRFEEHQHQAQNSLDSYLVLADSDPSMDTRSFKMDMVAVPAIVDLEFFREVAGKGVGRVLCLLFRHRMPRANINVRHRSIFIASGRASVDARSFQRQHGNKGAHP